MMFALWSESDQRFYFSDIDNGGVSITDDQHVALHTEQAVGKTIVKGADGYPLSADPKPTADEMWLRIQVERDRRKSGGFQVAGKWFHSNAESLTRYLGLVQFGANIPARNWKTMDGSEIPMTQELAAAVFAAAVAHDATVFDAGEAHNKAMRASAEPHLYDYSAGWPAVFGE